MISIFGIGLSALKAFGQKMDIIAENVANICSEGYGKKRAVMMEGPIQNVVIKISHNPPGDHAVDLAEEIPQSLVAVRGYEANLKSIRTEDEMLGTVLDIVK
ncbi:MAG: hypothetical protein DRH12_00315 [Deltaproteobacteria bacterium]|nr:MAG: hypothetical protein DRH12_00315 [Deltaproteobacteria bacterium]RLB79428.1 MAG: hypothetical protein DRH15_08935 [Deltaproteobacteria bacterium]